MPWKREPARWRFRAASELWYERFAERLAALVAGSREPAGLLLEWRSGMEGPIVAAPGASGMVLVQAAAEGNGGHLERLGALPGPESSGALRLGTFVAEAPARTNTMPEGGRPIATALGPLGDDGAPGGSWAVQLHVQADHGGPTVAGSLRLGVRSEEPESERVEAELVHRITERLAPVGVSARFRPCRPHSWRRREWSEGALRRFRSVPPLPLSPSAVGRLARFPGPRADPGRADPTQHVIVLGASGSGKTTLLARWGADAVRAGRPVVAVDVHGDLGPALVGLLPWEHRRGIVTVDASEPELPVPGLDVMAAATGASAPRIVAALRRGSDEGGEVYWGFRLERIFDHFVRLVIEEGGNLRDLYDLLTSEPRREAVRLATGDPAQVRFLDELRGIVRRNPEFLWPAAARIAKVALQPPLARLVAPAESGLPIEDLLAAGRSVIFRVPLGALGPEGAQLAATLLLARIYFGRTSAGPGVARSVLLLVDEAQTVAPTLLAEILADGRKFGIAAVVATQYPGRLEGRLRDAAAGAATTHLVLRTPRAGAAAVGPWVGLSLPESVAWLPQLSDGASIASRTSRERATLHAAPTLGGFPHPDAWRMSVAATSREFGGTTLQHPDSSDPGTLLFTLRSRELAHRSNRVETLVADGVGTPDTLPSEIRTLERRGWIGVRSTGEWTVEGPGHAFLGEIPETGAVRESAEHRALLAAAFRIFAAHGERLEIVRQGRFDTRLPDARWTVLAPADRQGPPHRIADLLRARRASWGWRAFGGRDVYGEAEVSGADRRERIVRDLGKARAAGAHCLFLVGDLRRAGRIRRLLQERGVDRSAATIWVLGPARRSAADVAGRKSAGE